MSGKHEPPSSGSFYLSVATSTLRAAIIVAAIVLGGVVLANAFPGTNTDVVTPDGGAPTTTPASPRTTTPPPQVRIEGAILQVLNGTGTAGLAADVQRCLVDAGAIIPDENIGNAPQTFAVTTLLWTPPNNKPLAEALRPRFFDGAKLQRGPEEPTIPDVQVTIVVGEDYAPAEECANAGGG
jgi:hypothetical protein